MDAKEACDNLDSIFGSDTEARTLELESILDSKSLTESEKEELSAEAVERGWL